MGKAGKKRQQVRGGYALRFTLYALRAASALGSAIIPQIFPDLLPLSSNARRVVDGERVSIWVHRHPRRRVVAAQHSHFAIILIAITDVFTWTCGQFGYALTP